MTAFVSTLLADGATATVERIGWTLIHSLWQFLLLGLILAFAERVLARRSANAKYALASAVMCLMVGSTIVMFLTVSVDEASPQGAVSQSDRNGQAGHGASPTGQEIDGYTLSHDRLHAVYVDGEYTTPHEWDELPDEPRNAAASEVTVRAHGGGHEADSDTGLAAVAAALRPSLPACVTCWLIGMGIAALRLISGGMHVRRLRQHGLSPVSDEVQRLRSLVAERLGVGRVVEIAQSSLVTGPVVIGWLRPLVLLPASSLTGLTGEQLEAVLAHELAHVRRFDYLVNLLQTLVETVFFYHPAVWWVSRRMRIHREDCCDDRAVTIAATPLSYASALLKLHELQLAQRVPTSAMALSATGGSLKQRIHRVLGVSEPLQSAPSWRFLSGVFGLGLVIAGCGLLADDAQVRREKEAQERRQVLDDAAALPLPVVENETGLLPPARTAAEREQVLQQLDELRVSRYRELDLTRSRAPGARPFKVNLFNVPDEAWPPLGRLDSIRFLTLTACKTPPEVFRHIAGLKNLESLTVINSRFTSQHLQLLAPLTNLRELDVMLTDLQQDDDRQERLGELSPAERPRFDAIAGPDGRRDHIASTAILTDRALLRLEELTSLRKLRLVNTFVTNSGVQSLSQMPLEHVELSVAGTISRESVALFAGRGNLETLYLLGSIDAEAAEPLRSAPALKRLELRSIDNDVANVVAGMPALEWLRLWDNSLSNDGLLVLARLQRLKHLDIRNGSDGTMTLDGIAQFLQTRTGCGVLHDFDVNSLTERRIPLLPEHYLVRLRWHKATSRQHLGEEMQKRFGDSQHWVEFQPLTREGYVGGIALVRNQAGLDWLTTQLEASEEFDVTYAEPLRAQRLKNEGVMFAALLRQPQDPASDEDGATSSESVPASDNPASESPDDTPASLDELIARLRKTGRARSAEFLRKRSEYLVRRLGDEDREVMVYGQVVAPEGESPRYCDAQMTITDDGWFVDVIADKDQPVAFRMFGCRPVDVVPSQVKPDVKSGETMSLGRIVMEPFEPQELATVRGRLKFAGDKTPQGIIARVIIKSGRTNSDTGGTDGFLEWPEKENLAFSDDLQFEHRRLAPVPHRLRIEAAGYRTIWRDIEPGAGATLDLGTIEIPKALQAQVEVMASETRDFNEATRRELSVPLGQVWRSYPENPRLARYAGGDMRFRLRPSDPRNPDSDERLHFSSGVASLKIAHLGEGELADFTDQSGDAPKLLRDREVPIESGHVYLTYHTHWKHWTLVRVVFER